MNTLSHLEAVYLCALVRASNTGTAQQCGAQAAADELMDITRFIGTDMACEDDGALIADGLPFDDEHHACAWCGDPCDADETVCAPCARGEYDDGTE